ncbi:MAG: Bug family tripartite tricarboxylate transporter substrate binding protein [Burkholderiales bacterium]
MTTRRDFVALALGTGLGAAFPLRTSAQAWPGKFVRVVVPFPAGAPPDVGSRIIGKRLSDLWGQQVLVENRPGAGGNIGTAAVARASPDGYTVLMAAFTHAVNPFLYGSTGYDPIADFEPVTLVSEQPCVMIVPNGSPAHSVGDFVALAKSSKRTLTFASAGHGTSPHLCGELFKRRTGIDMVHVPFTVGAQQDLMAGRIDVMFAVGASGISLGLSGRARALAVTTIKRVAAAPQVPTLAESGLPGFDVAPWWGFFVPARTSASIIAKINADTVAALADPAIRDKLESLGSTPVGSTPSELARYLKNEMAKWGPVIRDAGITIEG